MRFILVEFANNMNTTDVVFNTTGFAMKALKGQYRQDQNRLSIGHRISHSVVQK